MMGRFFVGCLCAWVWGGLSSLEARTTRETDRVRAIEQMERRLQTSAAAKRAPLTGRTSSASAGPSTAPGKPSSPGLLEMIFGKGRSDGGSTAVALKPVSGKPSRPVSTRSGPRGAKGGESVASRGGGGVQTELKGGGAGAVATAPEGTRNAHDLRGLVGSILSRMGPMTTGSSDAAVLEAGSYRFEDYVYEQRKRNGDFDPAPVVDRAVARASNPDSARILELLAQAEVNETPAGSREEEAAERRESATAMLGNVPGAEKVGAEQVGRDTVPEGQSSTYKKALAKLQTYEAPTPPPLRAVSGFQGLMKAKPSDQTVEQGRSGVLGALKLE